MALGYDVVCARDGQEAIDIVRTSTMPFHAVILDVIMPRLGGGEALSQIRVLAPNLPVVMASGFGADQEQLLRDGAVAFVPKPFTATIMSQVLSKVLGNG
jgi:CheY-like chemotaxis protein